jgi:hypothetical protein
VKTIPRSVSRAALLAALLLPALPACSGEPAYEGPPVVVIGLDGMTWDVAEPLLEQGRMPHLAALLERGVGGDLQTSIPTFSPRLWTTIATGVPADEHGILYFSEIGEDGRPVPKGLPYTSNSRKVPAIWNLAGDAGRRVDAVAWWVSWPAEQVPDARIVASYAAQVQAAILWKPIVWDDGLPELTWPPELAQEIDPILFEGRPNGPLVEEYNERFGKINPGWKVPYERDRLFRGTYHADVTHKEIFLGMLAEGEPADLSMVYFGLPDVAGHFFWRYREPEAYNYRVPPRMVERIGDHIDKAYLAVDDWIGEIVATLPADAVVLLVSDHGMGPANLNNEKAAQSGAHEEGPPGLIVLAGPTVEPRGLLPRGERSIGTIMDVMPLLLDLLRIPGDPRLTGRSLRGLMTPAWQEAHAELPRLEESVPFRAPTAPREPGEGMSDVFLENLDELGYIDSGTDGTPAGTGQQGR